MSLINRHGDMSPFDMSRRPVKQNAFLMPLVWAACFILTRTKGLRRVERRMNGLRPPYIVIAAHQGFSDYYIAPRALFPHRANYISDMEGFAAFGNVLYRQLGCIGKRRYTPDISVIRNVRFALDQLHQPVVIYPESRHCDAGITSALPDNIGKLVKYFGMPVAVLMPHGSYIANPFWDEQRTRRTRLAASLEAVLSAQQVKDLSEDEIQRIISEKLKYDEYAYQLENRIRTDCRHRAEGLHLPLYKCCVCGGEAMASSGDTLYCTKCHGRWTMDEYGVLHGNGGDINIPDWYRWERSEAEREVRENGYDMTFSVNIEALPNEKGFVPLGTGTLRHSTQGFVLSCDTQDEKSHLPLVIKARALPSVQTEYNYRGRGKCIVLSSKDCCYYCYSDDPAFIVTKAEFIQEYLYTKSKKSDFFEKRRDKSE